MSILDFPKPIMPVIGCRVHRLFDSDDGDETMTKEERQRSMGRDWYHRNSEQVLAKKKSPEYRAAKRPREAAWRAANREAIKAKQRRYYEQNRAAILARRNAQRAAAKAGK